MRHPEFKLWPWGVLALAVPCIAVAAGFAAEEHASGNPFFVSTIILSLLAAGDAFIVAAAGGRFSNLAVSIPVGAVTGLAAVHALSVTMILICYLLIVGLLVLGYIIEAFLVDRMQADEPFGAGFGFVIRIAAAIGVDLAFDTLQHWSLKTLWIVVVSYPLVMASVGATMSVKTQQSSWPEGMLAGIRAAAIGIALSAVGIYAVNVAVSYTTPAQSTTAAQILFGLWLVGCNFLTLKSLFPSLLRTDAIGTKAPQATPVC